jgi:hypothetical protein
MTQHTTGVQGIRSFTILQLLRGNIGKPGGCTNCDTPIFSGWDEWGDRRWRH